MHASPKRSLVSWLIALALASVSTAGYRWWLHATTGPLCRARPHSPGLLEIAALVGLAALLTGLAALALRQRPRTVAAQVAVALVLSAVGIALVAFAYLGAHHCFD